MTESSTVELDVEYAETLLEASGSLRDDIASGRIWGWDQEASTENAKELDEAHRALKQRLCDVDPGWDTDDIKWYVIEGSALPVFQVDRHEGTVLLSADIEHAVRSGFNFERVWRCKRVSVKFDGELHTATLGWTDIEHGCVAFRLQDISPPVGDVGEYLASHEGLNIDGGDDGDE